MTEFEKILKEHMARYPEMEPQDLGKLAFQSEFGPEHLVADMDFVLRYLTEEWQELRPDDPVMGPEPIGNGLCRFHLSACGRDDLPLLAELFCRSAREHHGTGQGLEERLACLRGLDVPGMEEWLADYKAKGCPAVRHSQTFRDAYRPHYRVIRLKYAEKLQIK